MKKDIRTTETIVQNIPTGTSSFTYRVTNDSKLTLVLMALGTQAVTDVTVELNAKGASADIVGIVVGWDKSAISLHTMQVHNAPETTSNLLVKSVLTGEASCIYDGGIQVAVGAQKTDAYQRNENLLLSDKAHAESKPSLEILANDVRCTHGATMGPIDENQLWYLQTRGLSLQNGRTLIVGGFVESALERVGDVAARDTVRRKVMNTI